MEIWHAIAAVESKQKSEQISQRIQTIETIAQIKIPDWHGDDEILKWQLRHLSDTVFQICSEKKQMNWQNYDGCMWGNIQERILIKNGMTKSFTCRFMDFRCRYQRSMIKY